MIVKGKQNVYLSLTSPGWWVLSCQAYHAGLKDKERTQVQEDWMKGKTAVISATVSFGMGVDKAPVRYIRVFFQIHLSCSQFCMPIIYMDISTETL